MHLDNIPIDENRVRALLAGQAPQWADLPLLQLRSSGTDNAMFRLGDDLLVRVPRRVSAVAYLTKELDWLPHFSSLPLAVPQPLLRGRMDDGVEGEFGVFAWMDGDIATTDKIADPYSAATSLATFLLALQNQQTSGAPAAGPENNRRGVLLDTMSDVTLPAIKTLADEIDVDAALALWQVATLASPCRQPVWLHGDIKADNLIARNGVLAGVIDWGLSAVGDPAADYAAAWAWVAPQARQAFREVLNIDDDDWLRAKGWALYGSVIALSYYRGGKNELLCQQCRQTLSRLGLLL